jgi:hypothetical protein
MLFCVPSKNEHRVLYTKVLATDVHYKFCELCCSEKRIPTVFWSLKITVKKREVYCVWMHCYLCMLSDGSDKMRCTALNDSAVFVIVHFLILLWIQENYWVNEVEPML